MWALKAKYVNKQCILAKCGMKSEYVPVKRESAHSAQISTFHLSTTDGYFILNANGLSWVARGFFAALEENNLTSLTVSRMLSSLTHTWQQCNNSIAPTEGSWQRISLFLMSFNHCYMWTDRQVSDQFSVPALINTPTILLPSVEQAGWQTRCPHNSALSHAIWPSVSYTPLICQCLLASCLPLSSFAQTIPGTKSVPVVM